MAKPIAGLVNGEIVKDLLTIYNDSRVYLGPFALCTSQNVVGTTKVIGCPACHAERDGNFCIDCGTKNRRLTTQTELSDVDPVDVMEELELLTVVDDVTGSLSEDGDIYIVNIYRAGSLPGGRTFQYDTTENRAVITMDKERDVIWFVDICGGDVETLKKHYNNRVIIRWGLLIWSS